MVWEAKTACSMEMAINNATPNSMRLGPRAKDQRRKTRPFVEGWFTSCSMSEGGNIDLMVGSLESWASLAAVG